MSAPNGFALEKYTVSRETLLVVLDALSDGFFTAVYDGDGYWSERNNDNPINADKLLRDEMQAQEPGN